MRGRGQVRSLAASPTMVGAITTLIVIVAVFLAYNANQGLPFVPVYRVSAEMCNAGRMAPNNEVRIGGNRVGVIESVETIPLEQASGCQAVGGDSATAAAKLNLKLDETAKPLPEDSIVRVRYRSSFGLKYLEVERGTGGGLPEGGTLPLSQAEEQTEFDDIANTFDTPTRENSRIVLEGFGNAFAARGASLNLAIESLNPLFANLKPVAEALTDPVTQLENFFPELGDAARIVAPVAVDNAEQFVHGAIAFGAISADEEALRDTISSGVSTLETGIRSLPVQAPFLRDFAEFSRLLRPGVRDLRAALPTLNDVVAKGAKILPRTVRMNQDLEGAMHSLNRLVQEPATLVTLTRLSELFDQANSAGSFLAPYQTVCNYWNYWFTYLSEHFSGLDQFGAYERVLATGSEGATTPDEFPRNSLADYAGSQADARFSSIYEFTPEQDLAGVFDPQPHNPNAANPGHPADPPPPGEPDHIAMPILHGGPYGPSGTAAAPNCQAGQYGYVLGRAQVPGQRNDSPNFGISDISQLPGAPPAGRTDLFLTQEGDRIFAP
jgi:ABC-type transporter Mla subunit MlaD